jgi:hypothetical protein
MKFFKKMGDWVEGRQLRAAYNNYQVSMGVIYELTSNFAGSCTEMPDIIRTYQQGLRSKGAVLYFLSEFNKLLGKHFKDLITVFVGEVIPTEQLRKIESLTGDGKFAQRIQVTKDFLMSIEDGRKKIHRTILDMEIHLRSGDQRKLGLSIETFSRQTKPFIQKGKTFRRNYDALQ